MKPTLFFAFGLLASPMAHASADPVPGYSPTDIQMVAMNLMMAIVPCEVGAPDFVARHGPTVEAYRRRHAAAIAYIETVPKYAGPLKAMRSRAGVAQPDPSHAARCFKMVPFLERLAMPTDPRFATPEGSWNFLKASLASASRTDALLVVSGDYEVLVGAIKDAPDAQLRAIAGTMGALGPGKVADGQASLETLAEGRKGRASFQKILGDWFVVDGVVVPLGR